MPPRVLPFRKPATHYLPGNRLLSPSRGRVRPTSIRMDRRTDKEPAMSATPAATDNAANTANTISEATRAVVQDFIAARLAGDKKRLVELFADEVDWQLAENPAAPWIRPRSTAAECAAQFTELMD